MKRISYILIATILAGVSCKKDALQRTPSSAITGTDFFNTPADLETYTNGLYLQQLRATWADVYYGLPNNYFTLDKFSDNISISTGSSEIDNLIRGGITPGTVGCGIKIHGRCSEILTICSIMLVKQPATRLRLIILLG